MNLRPASPLQRRAGRSVLKVFITLAAGMLTVLAGIHLVRWLSVQNEEQRLAGDDGSTPSIVIENAQQIVLREDGRKVLEVSAARITISPDRKYVHAWKVGKGVLFRDGKPFLQIQAEKVRVNQHTRDLQATGIVKAHGPDGFSLKTAQANWTQESKILDCPKPVQATLRNVKLETSRASYLSNERQLKCPQPIRAVSGGTTFTAAGATYDIKSHELRCTGQVRLVSKNATLRGGEVLANTARETVQVRGPVEIAVQPGSAPALTDLIPLAMPTAKP